MPFFVVFGVSYVLAVLGGMMFFGFYVFLAAFFHGGRNTVYVDILGEGLLEFVLLAFVVPVYIFLKLYFRKHKSLFLKQYL